MHKLIWAAPGHTWEYCFHVRNNQENFLDHDDFIFDVFERELKSKLGEDFFIMHRGTRLEVMPTKSLFVDHETSILKDETHTFVKAAVEEVFGPTDLIVNSVRRSVVNHTFNCLDKTCKETFGTTKEILAHMKSTHF